MRFPSGVSQFSLEVRLDSIAHECALRCVNAAAALFPNQWTNQSRLTSLQFELCDAITCASVLIAQEKIHVSIESGKLGVS